MLVQTIKLDDVEWECEYSLTKNGKLAVFTARKEVPSTYESSKRFLRDFTESEQAAIVQTLTGA